MRCCNRRSDDCVAPVAGRHSGGDSVRLRLSGEGDAESCGVTSGARRRCCQCDAGRRFDMGSRRDSRHSPRRTPSIQGVAESIARLEGQLLTDARVRILNPTREAFDDFAVEIDGVRELPNDRSPRSRYAAGRERRTQHSRREPAPRRDHVWIRAEGSAGQRLPLAPASVDARWRCVSAAAVTSESVADYGDGDRADAESAALQRAAGFACRIFRRLHGSLLAMVSLVAAKVTTTKKMRRAIRRVRLDLPMARAVRSAMDSSGSVRARRRRRR